MAVRAVCCELVSGCESLICREITGKRGEFDFIGGAGCSAEARCGVLPAEFPAFGNREICAIEQGTSDRRRIPDSIRALLRDVVGFVLGGLSRPGILSFVVSSSTA
jgi:hypothetical protein